MDPTIQKVAQQVHERVQILPDSVVTLVTSGLVDDVVNELTLEYTLNDIQKQLLENEIALVLMLFLPERGFAERIQESLNIAPDVATRITQDVSEQLLYLVQEILIPVDENLWSRTEQVEENQSPSFIPTIPKQRTTAPALVPNMETDANNEQPVVQPVRTMEHDMDNVQGYGAYRKMFPDKEAADTRVTQERHKSGEEGMYIPATSQDTLLEKRPSLTDTPNYHNPT